MGPILRKTLLLGSASILFVILAVSLTPITSPLPPYTGQYEVGILDLETEVERREIHPAVLKETGGKAFEVRDGMFLFREEKNMEFEEKEIQSGYKKRVRLHVFMVVCTR